MSGARLRRAALAALVTAAAGAPALAQSVARFDWFEYEGRDSVYRARPGASGELANPILAGFYPDPSITRVGDDYYLVTSTFSWFPGIPVFRSRDLASWTQIGNAIDRPGQLSFDSLGMSRGVFAPAISHRGGTFYVANTCVDCGGNFLVTARDPRGPWSDPVWLRGVEGIDPSLFFDDDGKAYLVNNRAPAGGSKYEGHRAIWLQEYDVRARRMVGEATQLLDGGIDLSQKPVWIEGPHVFKADGRYYLSAAEGGTAADHRQVILRAESMRGPYVPGPANPILTQRHLDPSRPFPVTSTGHADLVRTPAGEWWAVFLGVRPYAEDYHNTGRETFLLPVTWKDGWPTIDGGTGPVPYAVRRPRLPAQPPSAVPTRGNFTLREEFDGRSLAPYWLMVRTPRETWYSLTTAPGALSLRARPASLARREQPSFVGRRQQHLAATVTTAVHFAAAREGERAGLAAFQSDEYFYALSVARVGGRRVAQVERRAGTGAVEVVASRPLGGAPDAPVRLRIRADGARYAFDVAEGAGGWATLLGDADGRILSTRTAGGFGGNFTGVVFGMYAQAGP